MFNSLLVILSKFAYFTKWAKQPTGQESITKEWGIISIAENAGDPNEIWSKNKSILIPWVKSEWSLWSNLAYLRNNFLMEIYFSPVNFFFLAQYLPYFFFVAIPRWSCFTTDHVTQPSVVFFPSKILMSSLTSRLWETSDGPGKASWKPCLLTRHPG